MIAVSGTVARGPGAFHWTEDVQKDLRQVDRGLEELKKQASIDKSRVGLFGFSQGGKTAIELAAHFPDRFSGALALSAGGTQAIDLSAVKPKQQHELQGYVIVYGGGESPKTVKTGKAYVAEIERLGARLNHKPYPEQRSHSYPLDFYAQFLPGSTICTVTDVCHKVRCHLGHPWMSSPTEATASRRHDPCGRCLRSRQR